MLPYEAPYVSGTSPADQEKIMNSSPTSPLVSLSPCHHPAAAFSSFPWFPLSPFPFEQGLVFPIDIPIDEEAATIVEEELNGSPDVALPSDPPAADHMAEVTTVTAAAAQAADDAAAATALPEEKKNNGRKRFRTDRHSKIHTSQGLRDRRMRLSLDVARQFFDLQDMLGFDKASHTISWLLTQSKPAIAQLTTGSSIGANRQAFNSSHSSFASNDSSSEGEAVSPNPKTAPSGGSQPPLDVVAPDAKSAKESRNKARERARQRTREKNQKRISCKSLLADASTLDYQVVTPSKTAAAGGAGAGATAAAATAAVATAAAATAAVATAAVASAADHNFEEPAAPWNGATDPSWILCNNHEDVNLLEEELKIADSGIWMLY